jgi:hypothetical protein
MRPSASNTRLARSQFAAVLVLLVHDQLQALGWPSAVWLRPVTKGVTLVHHLDIGLSPSHS